MITFCCNESLFFFVCFFFFGGGEGYKKNIFPVWPKTFLGRANFNG